MKLKFLSVSSFFVFFFVLFSSCKKDESSPAPGENDQVATQVTDESQVSSEMDQIALDAGVAIEYDPVFSGNNSVLDGVICDATVQYNSTSDPKTITITYNGSNCGGGRTREGAIVLSMAQNVEWKNAGASFTITFNNLKITKTSTGKSITITGTHTYTNVSGGLLVHLATEGPITHTVTSSDMNVSFDNGTARTWNVAKERVFTYDNGVVVTITGIHSEGDNNTIAEWGTNRHGNAFTTSITTPLVVKQSCNFRVTGGVVTHATDAFSATATFGLNAGGEPTACPGTESYYYKLVWTGQAGSSLTVLLPY
jgi:hypothetical protein